MKVLYTRQHPECMFVYVFICGYAGCIMALTHMQALWVYGHARHTDVCIYIHITYKETTIYIYNVSAKRVACLIYIYIYINCVRGVAPNLAHGVVLNWVHGVLLFCLMLR